MLARSNMPAMSMPASFSAENSGWMRCIEPPRSPNRRRGMRHCPIPRRRASGFEHAQGRQPNNQSDNQHPHPWTRTPDSQPLILERKISLELPVSQKCDGCILPARKHDDHFRHSTNLRRLHTGTWSGYVLGISIHPHEAYKSI